MTIEALFLYLAHATLSIPDTFKNRVFQDMAYKLIEWDNIPRGELRDVFRLHDMEFEERCSGCNERLYGMVDSENPVCKQCVSDDEA